MPANPNAARIVSSLGNCLKVGQPAYWGPCTDDYNSYYTIKSFPYVPFFEIRYRGPLTARMALVDAGVNTNYWYAHMVPGKPTNADLWELIRAN